MLSNNGTYLVFFFSETMKQATWFLFVLKAIHVLTGKDEVIFLVANIPIIPTYRILGQLLPCNGIKRTWIVTFN